jgi:CubicO group peptidase (beta-lactamase class C family)
MTHRTERIAALLSKGTASGSLPGVAVAAVFPDGEVVSAAAGVRDVASGAAMHPDSVVWIASMTKAITGAAAMQQVEQGKLSLDAPIGSVLPQLANVQVLDGFAADGTPKLRPARAAGGLINRKPPWLSSPHSRPRKRSRWKEARLAHDQRCRRSPATCAGSQLRWPRAELLLRTLATS